VLGKGQFFLIVVEKNITIYMGTKYFTQK